MNSKLVVRVLCQIVLLLVPFLFLINSINYLTSNLNKQNKTLNTQKEVLTARLERKKIQVGSDLSTVIEDRLKTGAIEVVNTSGTISVLQIQPKEAVTAPLVNTNSSSQVTNPTGITAR